MTNLMRGCALPVLLATVCLATMLSGENGRQWLRYERAALESGQWWRVVTAHIVHLGARHTLLNLVGLGLVVLIFSRDLRISEWLGAGLCAAISISLGLYYLDTQTVWYVGLSGILHGWFALGAIRVAEEQRAFGLLLLAALAVKLGYEQWRGTVPFTLALDVGPVVVDAHLYGAAGAVLFYVALRFSALAADSRPSL